MVDRSMAPASGGSISGCARCGSEERGGEPGERTWQLADGEGLDQARRRPDLPCRAGPEESSQLLAYRRAAVLGHRLESAQGGQLALRLDHPLDGLGAERCDQ